MDALQVAGIANSAENGVQLLLNDPSSRRIYELYVKEFVVLNNGTITGKDAEGEEFLNVEEFEVFGGTG